MDEIKLRGYCPPVRAPDSIARQEEKLSLDDNRKKWPFSSAKNRFFLFRSVWPQGTIITPYEDRYELIYTFKELKHRVWQYSVQLTHPEEDIPIDEKVRWECTWYQHRKNRYFKILGFFLTSNGKIAEYKVYNLAMYELSNWQYKLLVDNDFEQG